MKYISIAQRLQNYLLLHSSFDRRIGILDGKSMAICSFALVDAPWNLSIVYSYVEEVISEISASTDLTFGRGIAGFGCILEYLNAERIIDLDTSEILEDPDNFILQDLNTRSKDDPSLATGLAGLGLYLLSRVKSRTPPNRITLDRMKLGLSLIVNRIAHLWGLVNRTQPLHDTFSYWEGWSGVHVFVEKVHGSGILFSEIEMLRKEISSSLLDFLAERPLLSNCHHDNQWLSICQSRDQSILALVRKSILAEMKKPENQLPLISTRFGQKAWRSLVFELIGHRMGILELCRLGKEIMREVIGDIEESTLPQLFPPGNDGSISLGISGGVCGTLLPLLTTPSNRFEWLGVLGMEVPGSESETYV